MPGRCRKAKQRHISGIMKIIYSLRYVAEDYGEYSSYGSSYGNETELPHQQEKRWKKVIDLSTWHGRAVVIAAAAVIIILLILIIGVAIPFFIILAIILYFLSWLKKRNDQ